MAPDHFRQMGSLGATEGSGTSVSGTASSLFGSSGFGNDQRETRSKIYFYRRLKNVIEEVSLPLG
jgi:hypothetical protein